jgi:Bifunctional DNA primase/polymerase, N-terminal
MTTRNPDPVAAALRYAATGWPVLPLHTPDHSGRCSCGRARCPKPGKHPLNRHGLHRASADPAQIRARWQAWPDANVGIATGRLVVVDVDGAHGRAAFAALEQTHEPLPPTLTAASGRGAHLYFHAGARRIANSAGRLGPGLDVRGRGGYVVAPPSLHADGHRYRWSARHRPAPLPSWLAELLTVTAPPPRRTPPPDPAHGDRRRRYLTAAVRGEVAGVAAARPGTRNDTLNRAAFRLGQLAAAGHGSLDELTAPLLNAALAAGLTEAESLATINSGLTAGQRHPRRTRHTQLAHGRPGRPARPDRVIDRN